jgi:hypothetical protein
MMLFLTLFIIINFNIRILNNPNRAQKVDINKTELKLSNLMKPNGLI